MSADLIERLRSVAAGLSRHGVLGVRPPLLEAADALETQAAEITRLTEELARVTDQRDYYVGRDKAGAEIEAELRTALTASQAAVAVTRGALEPFARVATKFEMASKHFGSELRRDDYQPKTNFTYGDFRRAREALSNIPASTALAGVRNDNRVVNLRYCTPKQNTEFTVSRGAIAFGERNGASVLTDKQVEIIRAAKRSGSRFWGATELANQLGVKECTVRRAAKRATAIRDLGVE